MKAPVWPLLCAAVATALPGCLFAPKTELNASQAQNRALAEQNRAQLAEIENLKIHNRTVEDRLIRSEEQAAVSQERAGLERKQLEGYQRERDGLYEQFQSLAVGRGRLPPALSRQLVELSQRYASLQFDPETGISKLDTDILFDSGEAVLKPGAGQLLDELVRVLKSPATGDLKIMVAGHTDDQLIAGKTVREKYPNNFHLSAARSLAVADRMKQAGLPEHRLGVAGFGPHQPIASNATTQDRQKNRRVEIFIMAADVPVVGWSDSTPSVYVAGSVQQEEGSRR
jgi:chemotaxis protein MotB